jgi:signal-transduction protein with cAMP-binding, CBS, and nucleotidyltransferase domain
VVAPCLADTPARSNNRLQPATTRLNGKLSAAVTLTVGELRRPARELPPTARASDAARQTSLDAADAVLVTDHGRILGIVTATDLVRMLARAVS